MKVRLSESAIRCRLVPAELDVLLTGRAVVLEVRLPKHHAIRMSVQAAAVGDWRLDSDPTGLWLNIPRGELEAFAKSLPTRESIVHTFDLERSKLEIEVDVDIHQQT